MNRQLALRAAAAGGAGVTIAGLRRGFQDVKTLWNTATGAWETVSPYIPAKRHRGLRGAHGRLRQRGYSAPSARSRAHSATHYANLSQGPARTMAYRRAGTNYRYRSGRSRPQSSRGTQARWNKGGKVMTKYPKVVGGKQGTPNGTMVVYSPPYKLKKIHKEYPHVITNKIYLAKAAGGLLTTTPPSMGFLNKLDSTASLNESCASFMILSLNHYPAWWAQMNAATGTAPGTGVGVTSQTVKHCGLKWSSETNKFADLTSEALVTESSKTPSNAQTESGEFHAPKHYITGVRVNVIIGNQDCPIDQTISIKLCRMSGDVAYTTKDLLEPEMQELVNQQTQTNNKYFETLWCYSKTVKGHTQQNSHPVSKISINKFIKMALLRSTIRKDWHGLQETGNVLAQFQKPTFTRGVSNPLIGGTGGDATDPNVSYSLFNNLYLVVTSKVASSQFNSVNTRIEQFQISGATAMTTVTPIQTTTTYIKEQDLEATTAVGSMSGGYARFDICGEISIQTNVHDFRRSI